MQKNVCKNWNLNMQKLACKKKRVQKLACKKNVCKNWKLNMQKLACKKNMCKNWHAKKKKKRV